MKWILSLGLCFVFAFAVFAGPFGLLNRRSPACANGQCANGQCAPAVSVTVAPAPAPKAADAPSASGCSGSTQSACSGRQRRFRGSTGVLSVRVRIHQRRTANCGG